ncbi:hypothetical protein [Rhizobium ruizarguesonis]|uniref:hypothetical protein n=1 Tax=Rhizobium ruizarguesonis TaxID=2081791 RepID=UPI001FDFAE28|nr:hypothetical protein [Rhizobium ruizarguesonis]WSH25520.1 hypothetical protein U8Q07_35040 [Rhizobium ruizarguesonis]WSH37864.1 hypothetical protein U8P70_31410 [Rhizobium ruizarguesonis]
MRAAEKTQSPVIVQASLSARKYADDVFLAHLFRAAAARTAGRFRQPQDRLPR